MTVDPRALRPTELVRVINSTPLGPVISERQLHRHRERAGLRIGDGNIPGLAVPGNHDYCTLAAECSGHFERHFAPWQEGRRVDDHRYPFAQRAGSVWLIGVNAATGNRFPWDAGGGVRCAR